MKKTRTATLAVAVLLSAFGLTACSQADTVNHNLDKEAEQFKVFRKISFINGITDKEMLVIQGYCSLEYQTKKIDVTCKDDGKFYRDTLTRSDNSFAVSQQLQLSDVSDTHYKFIVRPGTLIPDVDIQGGN